jgi:hypothetical protein
MAAQVAQDLEGTGLPGYDTGENFMGTQPVANDGEDAYADQVDDGTYYREQMWAQEDFSSLPSGIRAARPKPRLTEEEKFAREVVRRRQADLERRARIFDAKRRTIGIDTETLDAQVQQNLDKRNMDKAYDRIADKNMTQIDKQLKLIEIDKQRAKREREIHCKEHSLQHHHFEARDTFDLNDPQAKRKGMPARVGDDDERLGPASMQKFGGEDLMRHERKRQQNLAQVSFIEQQKFEKAMIAKQPDDGFLLQVEEITAVRNEIEQNEANLRKELQKKQYMENVQQAADNDEMRKNQTMETMAANDRELNHHATDQFLNECAPSHHGSRVIRAQYKGSTRDERMEVARQQRNQALEKELSKATEDHENRQFANQVESTRKQLVAMERDKQRRRRELREQMAQDNLQIRGEQKAKSKQTLLDFKNEFSPEFFEQFGRGCR